MMKVVEVLRMNEGIGDTSYAKNSSFQKKAILMTKPITDRAIVSLYASLSPKVISIADLGCSSGPNTFLAVSNLVKAVNMERKKLRLPAPEFQIYLNDLPSNDFNTIFQSLAKHEEDFRREMGDGFGLCFFNGIAGSFYDRLFPTNTLHFIHSSYSVHWLSQVPKGIEENKGNICVASTSPPNVKKAYYDQFERDFLIFLKYRSEELMKGGRMVLTFQGRKTENPTACYIWELLAMALGDLVAKGFLEEEKLNSFNVPLYLPSLSEVKFIVEKDGSLSIESLEACQFHWPGADQLGEDNGGYTVAGAIRAIAETMLVSHFGEGIIDQVFHTYRQIVAQYDMSPENTHFVNVVVSLIKK